MPDDSMQMPDNEAQEPIQVGDELPVKLDTLMVGGERPAVDDHVEVTVGGTVSRIIDDCAYVKVETANDQQIETPKGDQEGQDLAQQSRQLDMMGATIGGSGMPPSSGGGMPPPGGGY
jgi:hypothetical protein